MTVDAERCKRILSANIQALLDAREWSWYRLAKESDVSGQTISNICNGMHEPKASILTRIAAALDTTPNDLLTERKKSRKVLQTA